MLSWKFLNWKQAQTKVNKCNQKIRRGEKEKAKKGMLSSAFFN